jgi:hypothetical protein
MYIPCISVRTAYTWDIPCVLKIRVPHKLVRIWNYQGRFEPKVIFLFRCPRNYIGLPIENHFHTQCWLHAGYNQVIHGCRSNFTHTAFSWHTSSSGASSSGDNRSRCLHSGSRWRVKPVSETSTQNI